MSIANGVFQILLITLMGRLASENYFVSFLTAMAVVAIAEHGSDFGLRMWAMSAFATTSKPVSVLIRSLKGKMIFSTVMLPILLLLPIPALTGLQVTLCFLIAVSQPSTDPLHWYLRAHERLDQDAVVLVTWKFFCTSGMAFCLWLGQGLTALLLIWLLANVIRVVVVGALFRSLSLSKVKAIINQKDMDKNISESALSSIALCKLAMPTGASFLLMSLNQRVMLIALSLVASTRDVSLFGAAHTLVSQAGFIAIAVALSFMPSLARAHESGSSANFRSLVTQKIIVVCLLVGALSLIGMVASPLIVSIIYGDKYPGASELMLWLWPGLYLWSLSVAARYLLVLKGSRWVDLTGSCLGLVVSLSILFTLSWRLQPSLDLAVVAGGAWLVGLLAESAFKIIMLSRSGVVSLLASCLASGVLILLFLIALLTRF